MKASHRRSLSTSEPLEQGRYYHFDFSTWPVDWKLAAGHRLELRLSAGSTDFFLPPTTPLPDVTLALGGRNASYITLP
ncbi:CocE/NonD family hydrolase C-terminal non-catalytic domain-containing protein [Streptomyces sp. NPDC021098]|uniref:CocE/NonD family hydrolase C-terminal non-catalytic domain-containing protein n=1 Tax=unclassified Streptomyces TaxID=2593676 RepID=UPI0037BBF578